MSDNKNPIGIKPDGTPYKVLVIDDSLFVFKQLKQILEAEKFQVLDNGKDGFEGIEKFKEHQKNLDLITLDITMPKLDGISTLEKIMEIDKNAKVLIVSAIGKEDLVKKALFLGAKSYLVKPLQPGNVIDKIKFALNLK